MTRLFATRRALLGTALAAGALGARAPGAFAAVPEAATLLAPGPEGGPTAEFAARAAEGLSRALVEASALRVSVLGGPDGITAANRFATLVSPPERLLMLAMPGLAAHALLTGDGRARFEPRNWPPIAACLQPAVLAGRGAADPTWPLRVAVPVPAAPEAASLLALELLGWRATPVFVGPGAAPEAAVADGAADALVLAGSRIETTCRALDLLPWFAFDDMAAARDPTLPEVPALGELLPGSAAPELVEAVRAAGAALRVRGLLVLPKLTAAASVALWRDAARRWPKDDGPGEARSVGTGEALGAHGSLCPGQDAVLAYRSWLQDRLDWRAA